jgi:hypothetical protein
MTALRRYQKPSLEQKSGLGTGRRSGSKPPLLVSRAQRRLWRDRKTLEISWKGASGAAPGG